MARRKSKDDTFNTDTDSLFAVPSHPPIEQPAPKKPRSKRMSERLFKKLRERIEETPINVPQAVLAPGEREAYEKLVRKTLLKMPKDKLVDAFIARVPCTARDLSGIEDPWPVAVRKRAVALDVAYAERKALLKEIDDAELAFLAGDDYAGQALVEKIAAYAANNSTT